MSKNKKFKPNDKVISSSWRNDGVFKVINADDPTKVVILNDRIRAIVKSNDLTLIENGDDKWCHYSGMPSPEAYVDYGSIRKLNQNKDD